MQLNARPVDSPLRSRLARAAALALATGAFVGFVLGLIGGGGSILAVPALVYLVGVPTIHVAIVSNRLPSLIPQRLSM